jgi:ATP-binding cassette, subfamily A (ABC1), member 3
LAVLENINIWRKIKTATLDNTDDEDDVLVECDLLDKAHSAAKSLSGGQMRKMQLAIAFVGGSRVCCIDEATSGLVKFALKLSLTRSLTNIFTGSVIKA